jgi:hypothetical protein
LLYTPYKAHIKTAANIKISPRLNEKLLSTLRFPEVNVRNTPRKDIRIPSNLFRLILSFKNKMQRQVVIIGLVAPIMEEFIAVVYLRALKKSTWYPNIPITPVIKKDGISAFLK